jgi:hypothetical protein
MTLVEQKTEPTGATKNWFASVGMGVVLDA